MERSTYNDAQLECCPGGCVRDIKGRTMLYLTQILRVIHIHAGSNNLRGRSMYDGGHGKREALHSYAGMLLTVQ